jgi:hypothetical protein
MRHRSMHTTFACSWGEGGGDGGSHSVVGNFAEGLPTTKPGMTKVMNTHTASQLAINGDFFSSFRDHALLIVWR